MFVRRGGPSESPGRPRPPACRVDPVKTAEFIAGAQGAQAIGAHHADAVLPGNFVDVALHGLAVFSSL